MKLLRSAAGAVFFLVAVAGVLAQQPRQAHSAHSDLTGTWSLNRDLSDDPATVITRMREGGDGGHRPPFGGHGGAFGGGGRSMNPDQMPARMAWLEPPPRLTIVQSDTAVTLTDGDGRSQTFAVTNQKQRLSIGGQTIEVRAKWDGDRLVKEMSLREGARIIETYSTTGEPRQLHFLEKQRIDIHKGDEIDMIGAPVSLHGTSVILAREITRADQTWTIRDAAGQPLWSGKDLEPGRSKKAAFLGLATRAPLILLLIRALA